MASFGNNPYLLALGIVVGLNTLGLLLLLWRFWDYRKKQKALLAGEEIPDLEEIVLKHKKILATHNKNLKELGEILEEIVERNQLNVQKVGMVRFNPFADAGSNMSFALALLDGRNNGIVISSLHGREGTRIYGKPIAAGESKYLLTDEERQAIEQAVAGDDKRKK